MMRKMLASLALATLAIGVAAADTPSTAPPRHGPNMERLATLLDLTDSQKQQLQQLFEEQRTQMHAQMQALHDQALATGQKPDFQQLHAAHEQQRTELLSKAQGILSADQFKKFQLLTERPQHGRWGRHPGPGAAPPPQN